MDANEAQHRYNVARERAQYYIRFWLKNGKLRIDDIMENCHQAGLLDENDTMPRLIVQDWVSDLKEQGLVKTTVINHREYWVELE